jgi:SAM-dependent methyltransferase
MPSTARYDGVADYYDENLREFTLAASETLAALLGPGPGRVLDLGCGSGLHFETFRSLGWTVTGIDASVDQLRIARDRGGDDVELVRGDAADLPFEDRSFGAVTAVFVHTDIGDYAAGLAEAARVLQPGGRLVHLGLHPCFTGPFSRYQGPDEPPFLFPGYRRTSWTKDAPGFGEGLRRIVGAYHLPLADLLNAFVAAGFRLERFEEPPGHDFPRVLAVAAGQPARP